jgi:ATP-dependent DNA helicase RecG
MTLETSIEYVKGIGPEKAKLIKSVLGISTVEDLLNFYPLRYLDKSKVHKVSQLGDLSTDVQLKGRITNIQEIQTGKTKVFQLNSMMIQDQWIWYGSSIQNG